jgi:glycosyltransferase involved in cell wall biosynthesis
MKISVIIPVYNGSATIDATIGSVLGQTHAADEILVLDDGSTDDTFARLQTYGSKIKVFKQANHGLAYARNYLCRQSAGDLVAFLDADDVWHPDYLKTQFNQFVRHAKANAFFCGHIVFKDDGQLRWPEPEEPVAEEVIDPAGFLARYNRAPGPFFPSFCCVPKLFLNLIGEDPFPVMFRRAEDFWFMNSLPLYGQPVVYNPMPLVAYRLTPGSLSSDRIKNMALAVNALEILEEKYLARRELLPTFRKVHASVRRRYGRLLLGAGRRREARAELRASLRNNFYPASVAKSLGLLILSRLPKKFQPAWPSEFRD